MHGSLIRVVVALIAAGAARVGAQSTNVFVAADEGARLRPIARYDGREWTQTCDVTGVVGARQRTASIDAPRILASAAVRIDPIRQVKAGTPEWAGLEPVIRRLFRQREREQNVTPSALASREMTIEALSANPQGSLPQLYFFNASKSLPDSRGDVDLDDDGEVDPPGTLRVDVSGWLRAGAGSATPLGTNATLSWEQDEDRPEGSRRSELQPVALLRIGDRSVWVLRGRAAGATWFTLYDVGVSGVRTLVRSGSPC